MIVYFYVLWKNDLCFNEYVLFVVVYRVEMVRDLSGHGLLEMGEITLTRVRLMAMLLAYTQFPLVRLTSLENRRTMTRTVRQRWLLPTATTLPSSVIKLYVN